nr:hypothetical protein [Tanacetum cinerariifolium]
MAAKIKAHDLEISGLKARVKSLEDKDRGGAEPTQEDAPIKGGIIETREEVRLDKSIELGSNETDQMVTVLSSMEAANILTSKLAAFSVSPVTGISTKCVPTVSRLFPTASTIFTTASMVTPYTRRLREISTKDKGKEKVVESEVPKKRKLQEQIDAQVAKEIEEEFPKESQRESLDRNNEVIIKHLQEYEQAEADLTVGEKIELINELLKYQDHHAKILKYQVQQSKPLPKKEQKEFYMSVLRSHAGWKTRHFRGMTLEEIKEKFIFVWKQFEDFMPTSSKEEDLKGMMQLVPLEEVYVEALQKIHNIANSPRLCTRIIESIVLKLFGYFTVSFYFIVILLDHQRVAITLQSKVVDPTLRNNNGHQFTMSNPYQELTSPDQTVFDDSDGIACLPNEEIFAELERIGYEKPYTKLTFYKAFFSVQWKFLIYTIVQCMSAKRTAWNKFSSSVASAVIYLATGRKFNFSKYIFDSIVRNVDSPSKFLMYPRFLQVTINAQVDDLSSYNTKYTSPALTQKVFANMWRIAKGFSGVDTPLFDAMLVQQQVQDDVAEVEEDEDDERVRKLEKKRKFKSSSLKRGGIAKLDADEDVTLVDVDAEVKMDTNIQGRMAESQAKAYNLDLQHSKKVLSMQDTDEAEPAEVEEVLKVVTATKLMTKVVTTPAPITTVA